jgi:hypothetical protein
MTSHLPQQTQQLKDRSYRVRRPQVILLSGREPDDGTRWQTAHRDLLDRERNRMAPEILACGLGSATAALVAGVASHRAMAFVSEDDDPAAAATRFCVFAQRHVFGLAEAALGGAEGVDLTCPEGFRLAVGPAGAIEENGS